MKFWMLHDLSFSLTESRGLLPHRTSPYFVGFALLASNRVRLISGVLRNPQQAPTEIHRFAFNQHENPLGLDQTTMKYTSWASPIGCPSPPHSAMKRILQAAENVPLVPKDTVSSLSVLPKPHYSARKGALNLNFCFRFSVEKSPKISPSMSYIALLTYL